MSFEMPSNEQPKSELEQIKADIEKTENELRAMDADAPEMGWLQEKVQSLYERMGELEKPELRTQHTYGVPMSEKQLLEEQEKDAAAKKIREEIEQLEEERRRNAS